MPFKTTASQVMHPIEEYPQLAQDAPLGKALELAREAMGRGSRFCLVVVEADRQGAEMIKGLVTPADIVFGMADHFLKGAESIGPIFWEGLLEAECTEALKKPLKEVMQPIRACVTDHDALMEAVFLLKKHGLEILPVVRDQDVIGLIHPEEIVNAITRIAAESGGSQ